jgi:hypothetical protein
LVKTLDKMDKTKTEMAAALAVVVVAGVAETAELRQMVTKVLTQVRLD